jgi:hypothetical protein
MQLVIRPSGAVINPNSSPNLAAVYSRFFVEWSSRIIPELRLSTPMYQIKVLQSHHSILVVEDNWIIALDAEQILVDTGHYPVKIAQNDTKAMEFIIKLGHETSLVIADELQSRGIPYFFASSYKDANCLPDRFKFAQMIAKPYTSTALLAAVYQAVAA